MLKLSKDKPNMLLLCGLPCSGKSTWTDTFLQDHPDYEVLSTDNLIDQEAARQGKSYSDIFQDYIKIATGQFTNDLADAIRAGKNIIIDRTNMNSKSRKQFMDKTKGYNRIAIVFKVPNDVLRKRLKDRADATGKFIPDAVIESMMKSYEAPTAAEGFDQVVS